MEELSSIQLFWLWYVGIEVREGITHVSYQTNNVGSQW